MQISTLFNRKDLKIEQERKSDDIYQYTITHTIDYPKDLKKTLFNQLSDRINRHMQIYTERLLGKERIMVLTINDSPSRSGHEMIHMYVVGRIKCLSETLEVGNKLSSELAITINKTEVIEVRRDKDNPFDNID